jgi:hypothetical protein
MAELRRAHLRGAVCALVGGATLLAASSCAGGSSHATAWTSCPRPAGTAADIRRFRVEGGETCRHANVVLGYAAFGHEGGCSPCHYLAYTCREVPGGLKHNSSGGSFYTYADFSCTRGGRRGAWRIAFH